MSTFLKNKGILITGATGSLGGAVVDRIMEDTANPPGLVRVFSRDEAKQYGFRAELEKKYGRRAGVFEFMIGDVRDLRRLTEAMTDVQVVIHAAALKHVPVCERNTTEAIETNIMGAENLVRAVSFRAARVEKVVALSTDKACAPFSLMGMTKAVQERIFASAASRASAVFSCVRMGNMIMSRGSIVPLFLEQIALGGPITITDPRMTRFFITLDRAAEYVMTALECAGPGQVYIPAMKAAGIFELARVLCRGAIIPIRTVGIRPGEKLHDILVAKDETPYLGRCSSGGFLLNPQDAGPSETGARVPYRDISSADPEFRMTDTEIAAMLDDAIRFESLPTGTNERPRRALALAASQ